MARTYVGSQINNVTNIKDENTIEYRVGLEVEEDGRYRFSPLNIEFLNQSFSLEGLAF